MSATPHGPSGRPRDPEVDARITRAAAEVFGENGWHRFTIDTVARRAGVGKASIYLRWPNKEALLAAALAARLNGIEDIDTGSVRDDLISLARQIQRSYLGESGRAALQLRVDAQRVPEVQDHLHRLQESQVLAARAIVRRAIARRELHPQTSVTLLLDCVCGGVMNHVLATPPHLRDQVAAGADDYAAALVDFVLASTQSKP
ncbi:hypothetical protein GCM10010168_31380 [Actinoplanes ianthinogenes]|uniref:HTH tetR-type domain-containing protein n=1 Tax=Actinoplanes ianthinogenes TaxID=122358 RepID=A0ABM7LM19_9ACTN|nr:TetR/AcrR family transcriptional regulator [Actinoplanes ianthinogenes]BCJ40279.1 hypothetical protein Aiant_09360 [Actinoplanes ianthinogenes]GGR11331.1 hypothetical protein GCM10010168_31380 [Actinoplanes ianthinogenes]